ncbi:hypothetical protein O7635_19165 [Asanoa sp. WMMD1127]|uniref:hypothetical protein n=1 Tax=Asanoa sp. WMMD1127 TaxID=3016107 RepID=UPI002415EBB2|nr:hypothetical protein [Asanoa sp. WMMD1127]MDG4823980.1 hypothetical protein [Asanoa sp. WMMD1127]
MGTRARLKSTFAALLLVAATAVVAIVPSTVAQAGCRGTRVQFTYTNAQNRVQAREDTRTGTSATCDGLSDNYGRLMDALDGDGKCANAVWRDPSQSLVGQDCSAGTWANYTSFDQQGNSSAGFALCLSWNCAEGPLFHSVWNF